VKAITQNENYSKKRPLDAQVFKKARRKEIRPVNKRIGIAGMGIICAAGNSLREVMKTLYQGKAPVSPSPRFEVVEHERNPVFEIKTGKEELTRFLKNRKTDDLFQNLHRQPIKPNLTTTLALFALKEALYGAKLSKRSLLSERRIGICLGSTVGCNLNNFNDTANYAAVKYPDATDIRSFLGNNPALYISKLLKLKGPAATVVNACSSGTDAVGIALSWIEQGYCDLAIAGGTDELTCTSYFGFSALKLASQRPCRPFDKNRDGLNLGEGAGILILENLESMKKRGIIPHGTVRGYATSSDAWHTTGPHPEGRGLKNAIAQALNFAGITPRQIGFVNAHATATRDNDRIEGNVLAGMFPHSPPVVATKSYTGHTLGAAGAIEAVLTLRALADQRLPATAGCLDPDPECAVIPIIENTDINARYALSSALAFGGVNSALVFKRWD